MPIHHILKLKLEKLNMSPWLQQSLVSYIAVAVAEWLRALATGSEGPVQLVCGFAITTFCREWVPSPPRT